MTFLIIVYACMLKNVTVVAVDCDFEEEAGLAERRRAWMVGGSLISIR
jgi:hypothetical protein